MPPTQNVVTMPEEELEVEIPEVELLEIEPLEMHTLLQLPAPVHRQGLAGLTPQEGILFAQQIATLATLQLAPLEVTPDEVPPEVQTLLQLPPLVHRQGSAGLTLQRLVLQQIATLATLQLAPLEVTPDEVPEVPEVPEELLEDDVVVDVPLTVQVLASSVSLTFKTVSCSGTTGNVEQSLAT